jgi:hypothetical protein
MFRGWFQCHNGDSAWGVYYWRVAFCSSLSVKLLTPRCEPLYATNTSQRKQETFLYEYHLQWFLLSTKTHNRTLLFVSKLLKHGRQSDNWNQPLNLRMRVCYLDYHEAGLCCYLVIHIENLLHSLQQFYLICDLFTDSSWYKYKFAFIFTDIITTSMEQISS